MTDEQEAKHQERLNQLEAVNAKIGQAVRDKSGHLDENESYGMLGAIERAKDEEISKLGKALRVIEKIRRLRRGRFPR